MAGPYHLKCKCGATCWCRGEDDPDTNSCEYYLDDVDWDGGDPACGHEDYECVDVDYQWFTDKEDRS
jgi:hypothetical protein